jgi:hypothetical protein
MRCALNTGNPGGCMGHFYGIETAYTDRLCCQRKERILPRICSEGVLTKYAMVVQVMDQAGKPPWVSAQVLEETETGQVPSCTETREGWQELKP